MDHVVFQVSGMHCTSCERLIKEALTEEEGVSEAEVSHSDGIVRVVFDKNVITEKRLQSVIRNEGYHVR